MAILLERSKKRVEEVTFYHARYDRIQYLHPERAPRAMEVDGYMQIAYHPEPAAEFAPRRRGFGGFYTTTDPEMARYLRLRMQDDPFLQELGPGAVPVPRPAMPPHPTRFVPIEA